MVHGDLFPWLVDFDLLARILDGDLRQNFLKYVKSTFLRPPTVHACVEEFVSWRLVIKAELGKRLRVKNNVQ